MLASTRLAGAAFYKDNHVNRFPSYYTIVNVVNSQNIFTFIDGVTVSTITNQTNDGYRSFLDEGFYRF